nr:hypothetical protein Iba_chr04dCG11390 [Ipomoea batatas]
MMEFIFFFVDMESSNPNEQTQGHDVREYELDKQKIMEYDILRSCVSSKLTIHRRKQPTRFKPRLYRLHTAFVRNVTSRDQAIQNTISQNRTAGLHSQTANGIREDIIDLGNEAKVERNREGRGSSGESSIQGFVVGLRQIEEAQN